MGDMEIVMAMLQGMFIFFLIAGLTCLLSKRLGRRMGRGPVLTLYGIPGSFCDWPG